VTLREKPRDLGDARFASARDCDGGSRGDPGVLRVLAVTDEAQVAISLPNQVRIRYLAAPSPLRSRAVDVGRPPP
jgi:hypothetical protein